MRVAGLCRATGGGEGEAWPRVALNGPLIGIERRQPPDRRVALIVGRQHSVTELARRRDARKQKRLEAAGFRVIPLSEDESEKDPASAARRVRDALK